LPNKYLSGGKKRGNNAVIQIKENQKNAYNQAVKLTKEAKSLSLHKESPCKKRNRIESRHTKVFEISNELKKKNMLFENALCIIQVERNVKNFCTKDKKWKESNETAYYISTIYLKAGKMSEIIRGHWGIETRNHYVKDVSMKEDFSRIRINPEIMARFRSFALNILRANKSDNIKASLYLNTLCLAKALQLKGISKN
jgi:predicted transposase YbfD/YdcC